MARRLRNSRSTRRLKKRGPKRQRKNKQTKKIKWNQKGCAKSRKTRFKRGGACNCNFFGGSCSKCSQSGGMNNISPFVGAPWDGGKISSWPGVAGTDGVSNHYTLNTHNMDPQYSPAIQERSQISHIGGKGRKKRGRENTRKKRGGMNFIPQDLVNMGRTFSYGVGSAYNSLNGYTQPVNPLPFMDQLPNTTNLSQINGAKV